jgi:DNA repair exonuclease SbcCD ATPase subunit
MRVPSRIFAIGGAGKAVTYELLESEWVQESILKPRPNARSLDVTIIDTAEEEVNRDLERIRDIRDQIHQHKQELQSEETTGRPGEINIEYLPITNQIQLHDRNDLIGEDAVPRIASGNGMDEENWWLDDSHINENLDFATGVVRKRGLGKALYYKAYAEDDNISTAIDLPNKGEVAVIAGLGGGTGSGLVLDLVKDLKQAQRTAEITLFGVLPNDSEGDAENANAFAALSELEHLSLTNENLFKDIILIPIDPTGFGGKKSNILQSEDALIEFDRATTYLIVSYYNMMDMEDPFADAPSYAPFTIGIPQVLRYNVDAIQGAKSSLKEILERKYEALEAEEDVYEQTEQFINGHFGFNDDQTTELNERDVSSLQTRLDSIRSLIEVDLFQELEYESVDIVNSILQDAEEETDDVAEKIDILGGAIRAGSAQSSDETESFVDSIDQQLLDVVREDLRKLSHRKDLLTRLRTIEDRHVSNTLSYLRGVEDEGINAGVRINRLETRLDEVEERHDDLERQLEEATEELEREREEQQREVERMIDSWRREAEPIYDDYQEITSLSVESNVDRLEQALNTYVREIEGTENADQIESVSGKEISQAMNDLETELEHTEVSISDAKTEVMDAVQKLAGAKESFLKSQEEPSGLVSKLPFKGSKEEEREKAQRDYRMKRNQLQDSDVFEIARTGSSLSLDVAFDGQQFVDAVEDEAENLRQELVEEFKFELSDPDPETLRRFEEELDRGASFTQLLDIAEEAFREEHEGTDELESKVERLEADLEEAEGRLDLYNATLDLFEGYNSRRDAFLNAEQEYKELRSNYGEERTTSVSTEDDDYNYVKTIRPRDILQLQDDSDIAESNIFDNRHERQRLQGALEELAENAYNSQYTGLKKRRLSSKRSRYSEMKVVVGVLSQAIDQIGDVADLQNVFDGAYNLAPGSGTSSGFASFPVEAGNNWDVGLGMFVHGVFLDNLRKVIDADGYHAGYQSRENASDVDIRVHHTWGLEEGSFVRRKDVLNMENPSDVEFFLRDEHEIVDDLLSEHTETVSTETGDVIEGDDPAAN